MKKLIFNLIAICLVVMLFLCHSNLKAQKVIIKHAINKIDQAKFYLDPSNVEYNPTKAVKIFQEGASQGNLKAMNGLAVLYGDGAGIEKDMEKSAYWFKKAAEGGYVNAWFNLGLIYKHGLGNVPQDFNKAFSCFRHAGTANIIEAQYYLGYMLFKGLGCQQNYTEAVKQFKQVVNRGSSSSMYMLGICYRNGYGIQKNVDSARYWLMKSAGKGYQFAAAELQIETPENPGNSVLVTPAKNSNSIFINKLLRTTPILNISSKEIEGVYSGYITRYDWSGSVIIGKSKLSLELKGSGNRYYGVWNEDGVSVAVSARLENSSLAFDNISYKLNDHYSPVQRKTFLFKNCVIDFTKSEKTLRLSGDLQLWAVEREEPEKPVYVALEKLVKPGEEDKLLKNVIVYPNPFQDKINIDFELQEALSLQISMFEVSTGKMVHSLPKEALSPGKYSRLLNLNVPLGYYVIKVIYGSMTHNTIVYKN